MAKPKPKLAPTAPSRSKGTPPSPTRNEAPLWSQPGEAALTVLALLAASTVLFYFDETVARAFDVPKAWALKSLLGGLFIVWLGYASLFRKVRFAAAQTFGWPVFALTVAMACSTLFSIDPNTSWTGVYERQFGFQGFLGCVGLYLILATGLSTKRAAVFGLMCLGFVAAVVGGYALLQNLGADPWPYYREPAVKVHSTLGNANFAGNALALVFPVSLVLGVVSLFYVFGRQNASSYSSSLGGVALGAIGLPGLMLVPGYLAGAALEPTQAGDVATQAQSLFRVGVVLSGVGFLGSLASGSHGPDWSRSATRSNQIFFDGVVAGANLSFAALIAVGLYATLTRGAIVGAALACAIGLMTFPFFLFRGDRTHFRQAMGVSLTLTLVGIVMVAGLGAWDTSTLGKTIRSIPEALNPYAKNLGKGQGTRLYLWSESPRVLTRHEDTLRRQLEDRQDLAQHLKPDRTRDLPFDAHTEEAALNPSEFRIDTASAITVWLFGIGIETYRYAFMSHKSRTLERRDPMTNHDNPHNNYLYLLASLGLMGLTAYLWLVAAVFWKTARAAVEDRHSRWERAISFGILISMVSYAGYSLAGFDSVGCSVFLFWLLGVTAVLLTPNHGTEARWLSSWAPQRLGRAGPPAVTVLTLVLSAALALTVRSGFITFEADRALRRAVPTRDPLARTLGTIENLKEAIELNPYESFYKQQLGNLYANLGSYYYRSAQARPGGAEAKKAERYSDLAEVSFYAALEHAWAPENIFIGLFQLYFQSDRNLEAIHALRRALRHSPHLGAVRANLASLLFIEGDLEGALENCKWALDTQPRNGLGPRVCGQVYLQQGKYEVARKNLVGAAKRSPRDELTRQLLVRLAVATKDRGMAESACKWIDTHGRSQAGKQQCRLVLGRWDQLTPPAGPVVAPRSPAPATTLSTATASTASRSRPQ